MMKKEDFFFRERERKETINECIKFEQAEMALL